MLQWIDFKVEGLLNTDQAGFRWGRSTCDLVTALMTYIENGFQLKKQAAAVFLDFTEVYGTIWHTAILSKLAKFLYKWFCENSGIAAQRSLLSSR